MFCILLLTVGGPDKIRKFLRGENFRKHNLTQDAENVFFPVFKRQLLHVTILSKTYTQG